MPVTRLLLCAALVALLSSSGIVAKAAPSDEAIAQFREQKEKVLASRVERLTRDIDSGRLLGTDLAEAYRWRGVTYSQLGENERAVEDFSKAIENTQVDAQFYEDRAIGYLKLRRFQEANQDLDMALGLENRRPAAHREKGRLAFYQRDFEGAARHFAQAMQNDRNMGVAYAAIWLHIALRRAGSSAPSPLAGFAEAFPPTQWPAPVMRMLTESGSPGEATEVAGSPDPESYLNLQCEGQFYAGEYFLIKGDRERARAAFEAAVATGVTEFLEHDWARRELEFMQPKP
jgi:lipoprotein NlpI